MSRMWWRRWRAIDEDRERLGVSFSWPRDTDLTRVFRGARRNAPEIAMREMAASPSQPDAGPLPVETTASVAPRPQQWQPGPTPVFGPGPSMPMRELSNDNHDRVWIAQGDDVLAIGIGDTPQEAAIEYARAVADLLRPTSGPDAFDGKAAIREQQAHAERGDAGDGHEPPPDYEVWSR